MEQLGIHPVPSSHCLPLKTHIAISKQCAKSRTGLHRDIRGSHALPNKWKLKQSISLPQTNIKTTVVSTEWWQLKQIGKHGSCKKSTLGPPSFSLEPSAGTHALPAQSSSGPPSHAFCTTPRTCEPRLNVWAANEAWRTHSKKKYA